MAIVQVYEVSGDRSASENTQAEGDDGGLWTSAVIDRYFYVETDGNEVNQVAIRDAVDPNTGDAIPAKGEPHPSNPFLFAYDYRIREMGPKHWMVTVGYVSAGKTENPEDESPTANWRTVMREESIDEDRFGNKITNAAWESYDPPIKKKFADWEFTYSGNMLAFNTAAWSQYAAKVNSDTFRGFPQYTCMVTDISGTPRTRGTFRFWKVTVKIHCRNYYRKGQDGSYKQFGWIKVLENKGFRKLVWNGSKWESETLRDKLGHPLRTPVYLKADGTDQLYDLSQANVREHEVQNVVAFSGMNSLLPGIHVA